MPKPWERQLANGREESAKAFYAFTLYRDLPAWDRSVEAAIVAHARAEAEKIALETGLPAKQIAPRMKRGKAGWRNGNQPFDLLAVEWNWVMRARAWDDELDRRKRADHLAEVAAMGRRHAQNADAAQRALMFPVTALLQKLVANGKLAEEMGDDPAQLLKFAILATRGLGRVQMAERVARGNPENSRGAETGTGLPVSGSEFTWVESICSCQHPHSEHNQSYAADPSLVPCFHEGCRCLKFQAIDEE